MENRLELNNIQIDEIPVIECYPKRAEKAPLVLVNHGTTGSAEGMLHMLVSLAKRGMYAVGADALWHGARKDKMLEDMLHTSAYKEYYLNMLLEMADNMSALIDFYEKSDKADAQRTGMTGISQGAYVAYMTMTKDDRIKAASPMIGSPDLTDRYGASREWEDYPESLKQRIIREMPLSHYKKMARTALLIQNSADDTVVPVSGTRRLDEKLRPMYEGTDRYQYLEYPGIGHECTERMKEKAIDWLAEKL